MISPYFEDIQRLVKGQVSLGKLKINIKYTYTESDFIIDKLNVDIEDDSLYRYNPELDR